MTPRPPHTFWRELSPAMQEALTDYGRTRDFSPGRSPLMFEGDVADVVMIVMSGWVKLETHTASGRDVFVGVRRPGDIIGEAAAVPSLQPNTASAFALTDGVVLAVSGERFFGFLDQYPRAWAALTGSLIARVDALSGRIRAHGEADAAQRLAQLLVHLGELSIRDTPPREDGLTEIGPPLSQAELGSWVDVSRETAARAFRVLREKDLIATGWRRTVILDLEGLRRYADDTAGAAGPTSPPLEGRVTGDARVYQAGRDQLPERGQILGERRPATPLERGTGPGGLSRREYEVALLAAEGHTNQQIAEKLVLSIRTVETHLSHIFTKLGVTSRVGVVAVMRAAAHEAQREAPEAARLGHVTGEATVLPLVLDPRTKLYLVALLWCRPWLADPAGPLPRVPEIARSALEVTGASSELARFEREPGFRDLLSAKVAEQLRVLRRKISERRLVQHGVRLSEEVVVRALLENSVITAADLDRLEDPSWQSCQEILWLGTPKPSDSSEMKG